MDSPKVLVIDSCRMTVLLLTHILGKIGVRVDAAADGEEGLEMASSESYPMIFIDFMAPKLGGRELCGKLRSVQCAEDLTPNIVLMTDMGEDYCPSMREKVGADGVFFKPLVPSQIAELVKETLKERAP